MTEQNRPQAASDERLDGWKRIAAYLNRDVRTVRRWEKHQGLPVRRLMHERQATVYAFRKDLDEWLRERDEGSNAAPDKSPRLPGKPSRKWVWVTAPLLIIGMALAWLWPDPKNPVIAIGEWDWVLVTQFENRTGEEVLDGTVEYALQRELTNSGYVKVVPGERAGDTLRLMKLPPDTPIDIDIGREISLRDGGIKILIAGRTEKIGNRYLVGADLISPSDGVSLASFSEEAVGQDEILPAVSELARSVRSALGEGLASIAESEEMLARVTTPSLHALRLFSDADIAMMGFERRRAATMLEEAVRLDPDFASAHLLLSYLYNEKGEHERADHHLERAVALAEHASERERLFILSTYYGHLGDREKAMETTHLLLRRYPDHHWANGNTSNHFEYQGNLAEARELRLRVSEFRPNSISWYPDMQVLQLAVATGDTDTRDRLVQKIEELAPDSGSRLAQGMMVMLAMLPVHEAWLNGDYEQAVDLLENMVAEQDPGELVAKWFLYTHIRSVYLALGSIERFREIAAWHQQPGWFEALLDYDSGRPETLNRYLETAEAGYWEAVLMAMVGDLKRAGAIAEDPDVHKSVQFPPSANAWKNLALGQIALSEGRLAEAIALLEESAEFLIVGEKWAYFIAMHSLAQAYDGRGEPDKAIEALVLAARQRPLSIFWTAGTYFWQRNQVYLHTLYLRNGQETAAQQVDKELREMLRLASPEHPFLVMLDRQNPATARAD